MKESSATKQNDFGMEKIFPSGIDLTSLTETSTIPACSCQCTGKVMTDLGWGAAGNNGCDCAGGDYPFDTANNSIPH
jgi:hypothetical protein